MFSLEEKRRIGDTLAAASDERYRLAYVYFEELFDELPEARVIFRGDLADHVSRFMGLLQSVPLAVELPDEMRAVLRSTGAEHHAMGLRESDYAAIFRALMRALARTAGKAWDRSADAAWRRLLEFGIAEMRAGWVEANRAEART